MHEKKAAVHILIADDDDDDVLRFKEVLTGLDLEYILTVASDGEQCMRILQSLTFIPDVVYLDINMPRVSGIECLDLIRKNSLFKQARVIVMSTAFDTCTVETVYSIGADGFIPKSPEFKKFRSDILKSLVQ